MRELVYSSEALKNLKNIYDHVEKNFSESIASETISRILTNIEILLTYPQLGKTSEISPMLKELIIEGNIVFYQITDSTIDIVFIKVRKTPK